MGAGPTIRAWARRRGRSNPGRPRDGRTSSGRKPISDCEDQTKDLLGVKRMMEDHLGVKRMMEDHLGVKGMMESHLGAECKMLIRIWDLHRVKRLTVKKRVILGQKGMIRTTLGFCLLKQL